MVIMVADSAATTTTATRAADGEATTVIKREESMGIVWFPAAGSLFGSGVLFV
jgi:hypothetical protein